MAALLSRGCCHPDRATRSRGSSNLPVKNIVSAYTCCRINPRGWERLNTTPHAWRRGVKAIVPEVMDVVHGLSGYSAAL